MANCSAAEPCAETLLFASPLAPPVHPCMPALSTEQTIPDALPCTTPYLIPWNFGHIANVSVFQRAGDRDRESKVEMLGPSPVHHRKVAGLFAMHLLMTESVPVHRKCMRGEVPSHMNKHCTPSPLWAVQHWGQIQYTGVQNTGVQILCKTAKGKWFLKCARVGVKGGFLLQLCVRLLFITREAGVELKWRPNGSRTDKC